jgi:quercetin dioxygenase-like cupin family protein
MIGPRRVVTLLLAGGAVAACGCASAPDHVPGDRTAVASAAKLPTETLTPLLAQALPNVAGKTFTSAIVAFPPAARAAPHRHGTAFVYAYVLSGTVISQIAGHPVRTYHRGQNWVEQPGAHHVLTQNASRTRPAKLLVVFVSDTGAKLKVDDPRR